MKKNRILKTCMVLPLLFITLIAFGQDKVLTQSEIPTNIQNYIKKHFPKQKIVKAEIDIERNSKEYEVKLDNRTELEFNEKLEVTKIESKSALPESVVPEKINAYVKKNYPSNQITDWEKEWNHQEIELNNKLKLEFSNEGEFIRLDD